MPEKFNQQPESAEKQKPNQTEQKEWTPEEMQKLVQAKWEGVKLLLRDLTDKNVKERTSYMSSISNRGDHNEVFSYSESGVDDDPFIALERFENGETFQRFFQLDINEKSVLRVFEKYEDMKNNEKGDLLEEPSAIMDVLEGLAQKIRKAIFIKEQMVCEKELEKEQKDAWEKSQDKKEAQEILKDIEN